MGVRIVPGENVWRLIRTDRDSATEAEIRDMVGPAMYHLLREAGEQFALIEPWQIVVPTDEQVDMPTWRIGAARPIQLVSIERGALPSKPFPTGDVLGSRILEEILPTAKARVPWWIVVRFWWRQDPTEIEWPAHRVDVVGFHHYDTEEADWLLDKAVAPAQPSTDPGAMTWGEVIGPEVTRTIKKVATVGTAVAALVVVAVAVIALAPAFAARAGKVGKT